MINCQSWILQENWNSLHQSCLADTILVLDHLCLHSVGSTVCNYRRISVTFNLESDLPGFSEWNVYMDMRYNDQTKLYEYALRTNVVRGKPGDPLHDFVQKLRFM